MMDINQCIDQLGLNINTYILDKSDPPHKIIEWTGSDPQPTQSELETAWEEIEAERKATQYQRDRLKEYPSIDECVHAILDGELDALQAKRKIVKERHPKGGN